MKITHRLRAGMLACALAASAGLAFGHDDGNDGAPRGPLVIGHRGGGSGYLPEHTLEATHWASSSEPTSSSPTSWPPRTAT